MALRATNVALDVDRADGVKREVVYQVRPAHDKIGPARTLGQREHLRIIARVDRDRDVETISSVFVALV